MPGLRKSLRTRSRRDPEIRAPRRFWKRRPALQSQGQPNPEGPASRVGCRVTTQPAVCEQLHQAPYSPCQRNGQARLQPRHTASSRTGWKGQVESAGPPRPGDRNSPSRASSQRVRGPAPSPSRNHSEAEAKQKRSAPGEWSQTPKPAHTGLVSVCRLRDRLRTAPDKRSVAQAVRSGCPGPAPARPRPPAPATPPPGCGCSWSHRGRCSPLWRRPEDHINPAAGRQGEGRGESTSPVSQCLPTKGSRSLAGRWAGRPRTACTGDVGDRPGVVRSARPSTER